MMNVQSAQANPTFVEHYIEKWRDLNQRESQASLKEISTREAQQNEYSQIGYWDSFANTLPGFIGSVVASDYQQLKHYNQTSQNLNMLEVQIDQLETEKKAVVMQIFSHVINGPETDLSIKVMGQLLDQLVQLEQFAQNVMRGLRRAENSEWWDGHTSDNNFFGAMNDYESRRDNMRAAHLINDLNNLVKKYNNLLSQINYQMPASNIRPLQELYGAGESIMDAELSESNPFFRITGATGDWWSSGTTLNVIRRVEAAVQSLTFEIKSQRGEIQRKIDSYVVGTLSKNHPDFVMEAGIGQSIPINSMALGTQLY